MKQTVISLRVEKPFFIKSRFLKLVVNISCQHKIVLILYKLKKLFVHHIQNAENGATVEFEKVLLVDNNGTVTVGAPTVEGAKVVCEVVSPLVKGDKVLVFHKKRRKGYRKLNGHRQQFTELTIKQVIA